MKGKSPQVPMRVRISNLLGTGPTCLERAQLTWNGPTPVWPRGPLMPLEAAEPLTGSVDSEGHMGVWSLWRLQMRPGTGGVRCQAGHFRPVPGGSGSGAQRRRQLGHYHWQCQGSPAGMKTYMRLNVLLFSADFSTGKSWTKRPKRTWRTRELLFRTPRCTGHAGSRMREADHGGSGSQLSQGRHHKDAVVMRSTPLVLPVGGYHSILRQHLGQCWQHLGTSRCAASPVLANGNAAKAAHTILTAVRR